MEWCGFCGWLPKGGMHAFGKHSMKNYKSEPTNMVIGYLDRFGNVFEEDFAENQARMVGVKDPKDLGFKKVAASDFYQAELDDESIENKPPTVYHVFN